MSEDEGMMLAGEVWDGLKLGNIGKQPMYFSIDGPTLESPHQENAARLEPKTMTDITRDELDAKLENNRSGLRADFAEFRAEMATSRREQSEQMGRMAEGMAELRGSIVGLSGRVDGSIAGLSGRIDGLTTSMGMLQWVIGVAIGVMGLIFTVGGIWIGYQQLKLSQAPQAAISAPAPVTSTPISTPPK